MPWSPSITHGPSQVRRCRVMGAGTCRAGRSARSAATGVTVASSIEGVPITSRNSNGKLGPASPATCLCIGGIGDPHSPSSRSQAIWSTLARRRMVHRAGVFIDDETEANFTNATVVGKRMDVRTSRQGRTPRAASGHFGRGSGSGRGLRARRVVAGDAVEHDCAHAEEVRRRSPQRQWATTLRMKSSSAAA